MRTPGIVSRETMTIAERSVAGRGRVRRRDESSVDDVEGYFVGDAVRVALQLTPGEKASAGRQ